MEIFRPPSGPLRDMARISRTRTLELEILPSAVQQYLQEQPEYVTKKEFQRMPLRVLSRALGRLSSRRVIDTYLRWLEFQRVAPRGNLNYHWQNTITHWTQSLRARGFTLEEITEEVRNWKKANGPFFDPKSTEDPRLPPSSSELAAGWKEIKQGAAGASGSNMIAEVKTFEAATRGCEENVKLSSRMNRDQHDKMIDKPPIEVPRNYICNRCHYVTDCPTNMDPKYDIPPGVDYQCMFCKKRGVHYFIFCPQNPDENSIYRRRQAKLLNITPPKDQSRKRRFTIYSNDSSSRLSPPSPFYFPIKPDRNREESTSAGRELGESKSTERVDSEEASTDPFTEDFTMTDATNFYWKAHTAAEEASTNVMDILSFGELQSGSVREQSMESYISSAIPNLGKPLPYIDEIVYGRSQKELPKENTKRKQLPFRPAVEQSSYAPNEPSHVEEFLHNLFAKIPSQIRNIKQPRLTALDMWDICDERKLRDDAFQLEEVITGFSPPVVPFEVDIERHLRDKAVKNLSEQSEKNWENDGSKFDKRMLRELDEWKERKANEEARLRRLKAIHILTGFLHGFPAKLKEEEERMIRGAQEVANMDSYDDEKIQAMVGVAIRKRIREIEDLRSRLEGGEVVAAAEMKRMVGKEYTELYLQDFAEENI